MLKANQTPNYKTYEDFDTEKLLTYAGIDCLATSGLLAKTWSVITEKPEYIRFRNGKKTRERILSIGESMEMYTMPAHDFICDMEINGLDYDVDKNRVFHNRMVEQIGQLEDSIFTAIGKRVDLNSGKVLGEFLYGERGLIPPYRTKKGEPSVDGDALKQLSKSTGFEWLGIMAKRGDVNSTWHTFVERYILDHVKRDGRVHPSYNLFGTSSFRISGDNPNLTQIPRPKHGYNIRECFIVNKNNIFITFDFRSAEVKILGAMCRDANLLKAILEDLDFHSFSASQMYNIPYDDFVGIISDESHSLHKKYKGMRQDAKVLTFSIIYGSSAQGIAFQLDITKDRAEELLHLYFSTYPGIKTFIEDAHNMAEANHYVVSPFGQRKWEYGTRKEFKYTAVFNADKRNSANVLVQNPTSSLGLFCFTNLNTEIKKLGGKSLCTVYDSIELEIPISRAAEAIELGFYYMNDFPQQQFSWLDFPVGVDAEIGPNWGKLHGVKRGITQQQIEAILTTF